MKLIVHKELKIYLFDIIREIRVQTDWGGLWNLVEKTTTNDQKEIIRNSRYLAVLNVCVCVLYYMYVRC